MKGESLSSSRASQALLNSTDTFNNSQLNTESELNLDADCESRHGK